MTVNIPNGIAFFIDADACPVKQEVYKIAERYRLPTYIVANQFMSVPNDVLFKRIVVDKSFDAADNWIAERVGVASIVITNDVPLASRVVKAGAVAITANGRLLNEVNIGGALAQRNLLESLRESGVETPKHRPFSARERQSFKHALDLAVTRLKRMGFN